MTPWPEQLPVRQVRIARPTDQLDALLRFYRDGLGLVEIDRFEGHDGYSGVMLGLPGTTHHLEFTTHADGSPGAAPSRENLLVLYFGSVAEAAAVAGRLAALGHRPVSPENPYWRESGAITVEDPDGWRVVLAPEPVYGSAGVTDRPPAAPDGMEDARLSPLSESFAASVAALHKVAEKLVAPARKPDNEIALEAAPGGFGTPEFEFEGARHRVRVEGAELVHEIDGGERRAPLGSLDQAGAVVAELLPADVELDSDPLEIDADAALALGRWYEFGTRVLSRLIDGATGADMATPPRLWPEHFDIATELGSEAAGARANFGLSPGDEHHTEPYLYVGPWTAEVSGELWQASGFSGAEMSYDDLVAAPDQELAAMSFFVTRRDALVTVGES